MNKYNFVSALALVATGCAGGGGAPDDELQFGETVPSEATLCTFTLGVTTRQQVEKVLGPPTNFNDGDSGTNVQYWYGNAARMDDFKTILISFDEKGIFESALLSQIPYPSCWRDQEEQSASGN